MVIKGNASPTAIEELEKTRSALHELQHALQQVYGKRAPAMMIYGSQARKEATFSSDIDILLIYPHSVKPGKEITRLSAVLADLNLRYQVLVSVLPISKNEYQTTKSPLLKNIWLEGVTLESI
jgi:predicted nucleotidyltransferase